VSWERLKPRQRELETSPTLRAIAADDFAAVRGNNGATYGESEADSGNAAFAIATLELVEQAR
jgi:hypothetical protein